jgi:hypothetical protein
MPTPLIWIFALLAAVAQMISIFNWLKVGPDKLFNREWWNAREVSVTKGRFAVISILGFVSLVLSAYGFYITYAQAPVPRILQWGVADKHCNVIVDTSTLLKFKQDYDIVLACGMVDPTIDLEEDQRIIMSGPFTIRGGSQALSAASNPTFDKLMQAALPPGTMVQVGIWQKVFLIPKDRSVTEIHKLSDVPRMKGRLF